MKRRAALYLLVSKGEQSTENQRPELLQVVRLRGLLVGAEYEEHASAARTRPRFDAMLRDAHEGGRRAAGLGARPVRPLDGGIWIGAASRW
jgi:DNA invertase Pin-like site-specific DNA recombinase